MKKIYSHSFAVLVAVLSARVSALESVHYFSGEISSNLAVGSDGNIWFSSNESIGRMTQDGQVLVFPIGPELEFDFIALGPDGNIWTVERYTDTLYVITPSGAIAHSFPLPASVYGAMAAGADGKMWISSFYDASLTSVDTEGNVTVYPMPTSIEAISGGPDGKLWTAVTAQILRVDLSGSVTMFDMPREGSALTSGNAIVAGSDGKLWLSANLAGCPFSPCIRLGAALVSVTIDGVSTIYQPPTSASNAAWDVAFGADGNPWLLESRFNADTEHYDPVLLRMTSNGMFTAFTFDASPSSLVSDSNGNLWFADVYDQQIIKIPIAADSVFSEGFDML